MNILLDLNVINGDGVTSGSLRCYRTMKGRIFVSLLLLPLSACSSSTGYHGPERFSGWGILNLDSETYVASPVMFTGPYVLAHLSHKGNDYTEGIYLNDTEWSEPIPHTFTIDSARGNWSVLSPDLPTLVEYVADSGQITITGKTDTLIGTFSFRMKGSDSTLHHFSGAFAAGPPAVP